MNSLGIIPARYESTRFPGKPLVDIGGKTMIQRVYEQASKARLQQVLVATDDARIAEAVQGFGGEVVLTGSHHQSGTDRCFEAYTRHDKPFDCIINIQGDEPFIQPEQINLVLSCFENPGTQLATLIKQIDNPAELLNPNSPKVITDSRQQAIYFSRHPIPYQRGVEPAHWLQNQRYYQHIGLYGFRTDILEQLVQLPVSDLERAESLEQLRWLEHGFKIRVGLTEHASVGIDTPDDLERAIAQLKAC